jgi:hypothetical protein
MTPGEEGRPARKPLVRLRGEIKTPPFSTEARVETGNLLRRFQEGCDTKLRMYLF